MLSDRRLEAHELRLSIDPASLGFQSTNELDPCTEIFGQTRGIAALEFGVALRKPGYNICVTGFAGTGRMAAVQDVLKKIKNKLPTPSDLCYVNNFKDPESPILIALSPGQGRSFKRDMARLVEELRKETPKLFESPEYVARKNEINETYEKRIANFFLGLEKKVKEAGFALVTFQGRQGQPPEVLPVVDGEPTPLLKLEQMVDKGRFPRNEYEDLKAKSLELRNEIDAVFLQIRNLQKEIQEKNREADLAMFAALVRDLVAPLRERYASPKLDAYFEAMIADMQDNLPLFLAQERPPVPPGLVGDPFDAYGVNVLVDNAETQGAPVVVEEYPTYRNLFGSIERVVDRSGVWRTDFSKIKAGSFVRACGGFLVFNLMDALMEPGVWPALKRALKSRKMEIQTYDPFYLFTTSALKPEPIDADVKVIVLVDPRVYHLLRIYDEDMAKIFKVRADFDVVMDRTAESVQLVARYVRGQQDELGIKPFDAAAIAALVEEMVREAGWRDKMAASLPRLADLLVEADHLASMAGRDMVGAEDVAAALEARRQRANAVEERLQELIDRDVLHIETRGARVGQVNGLAVYQLGDYTFGKPSRISAVTSMGKAGVINIEREAELSGSIHNKGVLILSGYLRQLFAQDKPISMSASIAFEQSYSGVDGDSASSTEVYALLSSLSGVPIHQGRAVTGSVDQHGRIQAIGGVNQKIEGFFACCQRQGLTGDQGVLIPKANVGDLMLRPEVVEAVAAGQFHIWAVERIEEGIEILTGVPAGQRGADGGFPPGTVLGRADGRLRQLAEGWARFGGAEGAGSERQGRDASAVPGEDGGREGSGS